MTSATRVPLVIVQPKRITDTPRGARWDRPVDLRDIYPTLLEATAIPAAESDQHLEGDTRFIVVCWHHRILFHDGPEPDPELSNWQVMDEGLAGPHSITTDGGLYVVDDTGRHGLKTYRRRAVAEGGGFERVQSIEGLGRRTHRVHYCAASKAFYVLSSNSQDLYKFARDGWELKLEYHRALKFLEGKYTRSFTLHDGHMFFTAGPGIIKARYLDDSYEVVARYSALHSLAGMNDAKSHTSPK